MMMLLNWASVSSRPWALTMYSKSVPGSAGWPPI